MLNDPRQPNREPIIIKRSDMENSGWRKTSGLRSSCKRRTITADSNGDWQGSRMIII